MNAPCFRWTTVVLMAANIVRFDHAAERFVLAFAAKIKTVDKKTISIRLTPKQKTNQFYGKNCNNQRRNNQINEIRMLKVLIV